MKPGGTLITKAKPTRTCPLSADRTNAACKVVMNSGGIDAGRVVAEGYGQEHPIASNDTPVGHAQNRRVDVRVTKK